jgi:hypothetical protein
MSVQLQHLHLHDVLDGVIQCLILGGAYPLRGERQLWTPQWKCQCKNAWYDHVKCLSHGWNACNVHNTPPLQHDVCRVRRAPTHLTSLRHSLRTNLIQMRGRAPELSGASSATLRIATTDVTRWGVEPGAAPSLHSTTRVPCCRCSLLAQAASRASWLRPRSCGMSSKETCKQRAQRLMADLCRCRHQQPCQPTRAVTQQPCKLDRANMCTTCNRFTSYGQVCALQCP